MSCRRHVVVAWPDRCRRSSVECFMMRKLFDCFFSLICSFLFIHHSLFFRGSHASVRHKRAFDSREMLFCRHKKKSFCVVLNFHLILKREIPLIKIKAEKLWQLQAFDCFKKRERRESIKSSSRKIMLKHGKMFSDKSVHCGVV